MELHIIYYIPSMKNRSELSDFNRKAKQVTCMSFQLPNQSCAQNPGILKFQFSTKLFTSLFIKPNSCY